MYEIEYNNKKIQIDIIKLKIKNMYIHVKEGRVVVKVPLKIKDNQILEFVNKKSKWIYEKVLETENKSKNKPEITKEDVIKLENIVTKSIEEYSKKLNVMPNKVRIKNIKYAWGSCSSNKNITINLNLALKDEKAIKYVVLHEMCHLLQMNHSKKFWNLVESIMPDYKMCKKILND